MRSEDETEINTNWVNMSVLLEKYVVIDMILDEFLCLWCYKYHFSKLIKWEKMKIKNKKYTEADCKSHAGGDDKLIFFPLAYNGRNFRG